jgi:hypothetical protein
MYITRMQVLMVLVLLIVDLYYALNALVLLLDDEACARNFSSDCVVCWPDLPRELC